MHTFKWKHVYMKALFLTPALLLLFCFNAHATPASSAGALKFINPWIAEAPPGASVMAGYMEVQNTSNVSIDILAISSDAFKSVEMHQSKEVDGFAKMLPQKSLSIPANGKLILKSGSYHLMLIKPAKWFKQGENITLNFTLSNQHIVALDVKVKKAKTQSRAMKCAAGKCGGK